MQDVLFQSITGPHYALYSRQILQLHVVPFSSKVTTQFDFSPHYTVRI